MAASKSAASGVNEADLLNQLTQVKAAAADLRASFYAQKRAQLQKTIGDILARIKAVDVTQYFNPTTTGVESTPAPVQIPNVSISTGTIPFDLSKLTTSAPPVAPTPTTQAPSGAAPAPSPSVGSSKDNPFQPNADGTLTWSVPGYYNLLNASANGGNPAGSYLITNKAFIDSYNSNLPKATTPTANPAAPDNSGATTIPAPSTGTPAIYGTPATSPVIVTDANVAHITTGIGTTIPNAPTGSTVTLSSTGWYTVTTPSGATVMTKINPLTS